MTTNASGKRSKSQGATPLILSPADIEIEGKQRKLFSLLKIKQLQYTYNNIICICFDN